MLLRCKRDKMVSIRSISLPKKDTLDFRSKHDRLKVKASPFFPLYGQPLRGPAVLVQA